MGKALDRLIVIHPGVLHNAQHLVIIVALASFVVLHKEERAITHPEVLASNPWSSSIVKGFTKQNKNSLFPFSRRERLISISGVSFDNPQTGSFHSSLRVRISSIYSRRVVVGVTLRGSWVNRTLTHVSKIHSNRC